MFLFRLESAMPSQSFSKCEHGALLTDRVSIAEFRNAVISVSDYMGTLKQQVARIFKLTQQIRFHEWKLIRQTLSARQ